jgi:molybdate transport system regulatory protein
MAIRKSPPPDSLGDLPQALTDISSDKRLEVLRQVAVGCSISQAAREVGISYKAAWQAIDTLSSLSGKQLVERTVGGLGGGGTTITPQGLQLLALADELERARQQVLARFSGGQSLVAGLGLRTSMRNQLPCTVLRCEAAADKDPTVWVHATTPGGGDLSASVTRESADLLGLQPGRAVLLLCKATSVVIEAGLSPRGKGDAAVCRLSGKVERITDGGMRDEVVLTLKGGGQWVGFAPHPFKAPVGAAAHATMGAASLVVALPN